MESQTTLIAAVIGVLTGVASTFVSHLFQLRLERQKNELELDRTRKKAFKEEIANVVQLIMGMVQEISWTTWEIYKGKGGGDQEQLDRYNVTAKESLSKITKHLAMIAATDLGVYNKLRAIAQQVYNLDIKLANNMVDFIDGKVDIKYFEDLKEKAKAIEKELPTQFAELLSLVDQTKNV